MTELYAHSHVVRLAVNVADRITQRVSISSSPNCEEQVHARQQTIARYNCLKSALPQEQVCLLQVCPILFSKIHPRFNILDRLGRRRGWADGQDLVVELSIRPRVDEPGQAQSGRFKITAGINQR